MANLVKVGMRVSALSNMAAGEAGHAIFVPAGSTGKIVGLLDIFILVAWDDIEDDLSPTPAVTMCTGEEVASA